MPQMFGRVAICEKGRFTTSFDVVGFGPIELFIMEVRVKKVLLVLTLVGLGFLAWRYFSNEPV